MSNSKADVKDVLSVMGDTLGNHSGIKFAHEMLVDILGALIPGVLFLFGLLCAVGIPLLLLLSLSAGDPLGKISDLVGIIGFLLFLILSYTIGHLFYRKDIKIPDKLDVAREQKKKLKQLTSTIKGIRRQKGDVNLKILELLSSEIKPIMAGLETYKASMPDYQLDEKDCIGLRRNIYNTKLFEACRDSLALIEEYNIYSCDMIDKTTGDVLLPWCIISVMFPEMGIPYSEHLPNDLIEISSLPLDAMKLYQTFLAHTGKLKRLVNREETTTDSSYFLLLCYLILHLQNESACATEARCDFPYQNYYKYLLKRQIIDLLNYVDWQQTEIRTKNKLNQYKIEIQIKNPNIYSILAKNESHIRMASSSWWVARFLIMVSILSLTLLAIVAGAWYYNLNHMDAGIGLVNDVIQIFADHQQKPELPYVILALLSPLLVFAGAYYIRKQVVRFIHYQRLREIYYTLKVYHECVGSNQQ